MIGAASLEKQLVKNRDHMKKLACEADELVEDNARRVQDQDEYRK